MVRQLANRIGRRARRELGFIQRFLRPPLAPLRADGRLLIHIGCGEIDAPGFINVDAQPYPHVHHVSNDITNLSMFDSGSADLIYLCHVLEHVHRRDIGDVLAEFRRVLQPGGVLRISVPDFDCLVDLYLASDREAASVLSPLLGSHANPYDVHYWIFTARSLTELLQSAGFTAVREWDPARVEHHAFEDWASRPVQWAGRPYSVSLNLEAMR